MTDENDTPELRDLITIAEAAELIGVKPRTFHAYASRGDAGCPPPVRHVGRTPLWDRAEVAAWHASRPRPRNRA